MISRQTRLIGPCMYAKKNILSELFNFLSELLILFTVAIEKFKITQPLVWEKIWPFLIGKTNKTYSQPARMQLWKFLPLLLLLQYRNLLHSYLKIILLTHQYYFNKITQFSFYLRYNEMNEMVQFFFEFVK